MVWFGDQPEVGSTALSKDPRDRTGQLIAIVSHKIARRAIRSISIDVRFSIGTPEIRRPPPPSADHRYPRRIAGQKPA